MGRFLKQYRKSSPFFFFNPEDFRFGSCDYAMFDTEVNCDENADRCARSGDVFKSHNYVEDSIGDGHNADRHGGPHGVDLENLYVKKDRGESLISSFISPVLLLRLKFGRIAIDDFPTISSDTSFFLKKMEQVATCTTHCEKQGKLAQI